MSLMRVTDPCGVGTLDNVNSSADHLQQNNMLLHICTWPVSIRTFNVSSECRKQKIDIIQRILSNTDDIFTKL